MKLLRRIQTFFSRFGFSRFGNDPSACPKCDSKDAAMKLTEWVIGHQVKNNGLTSFCRVCKACGHEWKARM